MGQKQGQKDQGGQGRMPDEGGKSGKAARGTPQNQPGYGEHNLGQTGGGTTSEDPLRRNPGAQRER